VTLVLLSYYHSFMSIFVIGLDVMFFIISLVFMARR
jgi:hypothetical protein